MDLDIGRLLRDWPYEPGQVNVRRIIGRDGKERIQLRLDLGLLQMETEGRPDGETPLGFESLLDYYENKLRQYVQENGSSEGFVLSETDCEALRTETLMYYHRYVAEFVLEDYHAVERDSARNLRAFDLCRDYADEESDKFVLEQYRPYVIMMISRARAKIAVQHGRPRAAVNALKKGADEIKDHLKKYGQEQLIPISGEIALLQAMAREVEADIPADPLEELHKKLDTAIREERYEDAASIRDEIRLMEAERHPPPEKTAEN